MASRTRPDWSRPLPRPLVIPAVMTLKTLGNVRKLLVHLPKDVRARSTWQGVANQPDAAARGADPADVAVALQLNGRRTSIPGQIIHLCIPDQCAKKANSLSGTT